MFSDFLSWCSGGLSKILPWILLLAATVAGGFGLRQSGKDAAYSAMAAKQQEQTNAALQINQNISNSSDADVANKLRQFYRD